MKINLNQIYKGLDEWRAERGITAESQRQGYIRNIMEELGELAAGLRDYASWSKCDLRFCQIHKEMAERVIIDALCDIAIFTINAGANISSPVKCTEIELEKCRLNADCILKKMVENCAVFSYFEWGEVTCFNSILANCAYLCEHYGFDFQIAMDETIKEISSRIGTYDENAKKWVKDESDEAKSKWYKADYEKARIKQ